MISEKNLVRLKISFPPIFLMVLLLILSIILKIANIIEIAQVFPLAFVFIGIFVIAFGSFFDFGANQYLQNMIVSKLKIRETDITNINREQFIMNIIYVAIGLTYILVGIALTFLYRIL